ncbi:MAG: CHASE3 domain-containing protein [Bacteroidetes bacterium]|jgi:two-component system CheB/CheR fusion protein|nr:CHASE3 domain-containing protein [Bacteroidota bacterium]
MKSGLNRSLQYWFGISIFILVVISAVSYTFITNLLESNNLVDHSNSVILKLEKVMSVMKDAETSQRGYILTDQDDFLIPYKGAYQNASNLLNQVQQLTTSNLYQQHYLIMAKRLLNNENNLLASMIQKEDVRDTIYVDDLRLGKSMMDSLRKAVSKMENQETELLHLQLKELNKYTNLAPVMIIVTSIAAVTVSLLFFLNISRGIDEKEAMQKLLEYKGKETAEANKKLASAIEELTSLNEEYIVSNESLNESKHSLQALNNELEARVNMRTKELQESEKQLRNVMDTIPQIAWTSTPDGGVNFYNKRWFEYTGLNFEESKAWGWKTVIHPDDLQYNLDQLSLILGKGIGGEFEIREKSKTGEYRWHLVRMQPIRNDDGSIRLWAGTATDIQELKLLQQQKDDFISIASHELKTPVTTLKASLQLIEMQKSNLSGDKLDDMIGRANKSVNKVTSLIDGLLNVSKFSQGQFKLRKSTFDLVKLIRDYSNEMSTPKGYNINISGEDELQLTADAERIEQVLTNLLSNAIKYAEESKEIDILIENRHIEAKVSVIDHGPGIPPSKIPYLFDRYFQVQNNGNNSNSGLGIGLYICSEIIKKHNGEIGVNTELGKGSTFWFTLPV